MQKKLPNLGECVVPGQHPGKLSIVFFGKLRTSTYFILRQRRTAPARVRVPYSDPRASPGRKVETRADGYGSYESEMPVVI